MDKIDEEILVILRKNARTPFAEIARKLGISEASVHFRVKRLIREGFIRKFTVLVSYEKIGANLTAIILIKLDPAKHTRALNEIAKIEEVYEVYDITGEFDAILKVRTLDVRKLKEVIDRLGVIEGVLSTQTVVVLKALKEEV